MPPPPGTAAGLPRQHRRDVQGGDVVAGVKRRESEEARDRHGRVALALRELLDASREARASAHWVVARSGFLCKKAEIAQRQALEARQRSRPSSRYARVEGTVDGRPSVAVVHRDGTVVGERALLRRVDLVVALGDTFGDGRTTASIGYDPLASTLSIARAYDSVHSIDVFGARRAETGRCRSGTAPGDPPPRVAPLVVEVERGEGHIALHLRGELDLDAADGVAEELERCGGEDADVTVDLSELTFIDACGVRVLADASELLAQRGRVLVVRGATGFVRRTLQMCEVSDLLDD